MAGGTGSHSLNSSNRARKHKPVRMSKVKGLKGLMISTVPGIQLPLDMAIIIDAAMIETIRYEEREKM